MGYDLHITRRENWSEEGSDISADEWLQYVRARSDLRLDPSSGPHFAHWIGTKEPDGTPFGVAFLGLGLATVMWSSAAYLLIYADQIANRACAEQWAV